MISDLLLTDQWPARTPGSRGAAETYGRGQSGPSAKAPRRLTKRRFLLAETVDEEGESKMDDLHALSAVNGFARLCLVFFGVSLRCHPSSATETPQSVRVQIPIMHC